MNAIDNVKDLAKLIQDLGRLDLYKKVLELQSELLALTEEKNNLRLEIEELRKRFDLKKNLRFDECTYWLKENEKESGPYCPSCWDGQGKLSRLLKVGLPQRRKCNLCGQVVRVNEI